MAAPSEIKSVLLDLTRVRKEYPGSGGTVVALDDISFRVSAGERVVVTGVSGSGKTTLLNVLGLLDYPTGGKYEFQGSEVRSMSDHTRSRLRAETVRFVFQDSNVISHRTALQNVELGLRYARVKRQERRQLAFAMVKSVGLSHRARAQASTLSGGERQRIAIARALMGRPRLLLCDEPTGNLDSATSRAILELLTSSSPGDTAILIVSHDPAVVPFGDRHVHLHDGRIVSDTTREVGGG